MSAKEWMEASYAAGRASRDAEVEALRAAQQWVLGSERLPKRDQIIMYSDDLRNPVPMMIGIHRSGEWLSGGYGMVNVTHWMPLPTPPAARAAQEK